MTNRDKLMTLGEALHGPRWQMATASDLAVDKRQVHRWLSGQYAVPDGVVSDLVIIARRRAASLNAAIAASTK